VRKTKKNQNRFFSYRCPSCGRHVETVRDRRLDKHYDTTPVCWHCEMDMWGEDQHDRKKRKEAGDG